MTQHTRSYTRVVRSYAPMSASRFLVAASATAALAAGCGPSKPETGCKDDLRAGDLVITEVFANYKAPPGGAGGDEGKEWFEIYNATDRPIELEGVTIAHGRPDGEDFETHVIEGITIAPEQYLTLGNSTGDLLPPYVDYGYSADLGDFYNSDIGKLELRCGDSVIDAAEYATGAEGKSRQLTSAQAPDYTLNDDLEMWCESDTTEFETSNFGTPGTDNDCAPTVSGQCSDGGTMRNLVAPGPGDLVITEFLANPPGSGTDDSQEWFEIANVSGAAFDLNGLGVKGNAATVNTIASTECLSIEAGAFGILAHESDSAANGGLPFVDAEFSFALAQSNGSIEVLAGDVSLDRISWTTGIVDGASRQLDSDLMTVTGNDDPANFCTGTEPYGDGALGTPGAPNAKCDLLPPAGMCRDGGTNRAIVKPPAGALVLTEFLANPAGTETGVDAAQEWFELKNTGATAFDLNELGLKGNAAAVNVIASVECKSVAPGAYALFAHLIDPELNGGLPRVDATFSFALGQSTGSISVLDGAVIVDAITWSGSIVDGASRALDPDSTTATDNDVPANFCTGTGTYGTAANLGTPKAANPQCP